MIPDTQETKHVYVAMPKISSRLRQKCDCSHYLVDTWFVCEQNRVC